MNAIEVVGRAMARPFMVGTGSGMSFDQWASMFSMDSPLLALNTTMRGDREDIEANFVGLVRGTYQRNGLVFACLAARARLFGQARFQFQQMFGGRTGALFGTPDLGVLERPEPGVVTGDMLFRASLFSDLGGDWFGVRRALKGGTRIAALRPDWTSVVLGSRNPDVEPEAIGWDPDTEVVGYAYVPGGPRTGAAPIAFTASEVAHFYPNQDPIARYRGAPLIVSVLRDILADSGATSHKLAFFRNAATPNIAITLPASMDETKARAWIQAFEAKETGALAAYRTLYFGGGMEATPIGSNFQQMTFTELQQAAEARIAAATGMHRVVLALSEGSSGALNGPNFGGVARLVADTTLRPLWGNMSGSLETIVPPPSGGTRLWYDDRDIPFLRADVKDQADIQQANAVTVTTYVKEGFTPASAIDAVVAGDITRLVHTGLVSVQLQPPGASLPTAGGSQPPANQARTFQSLPVNQLQAMVAAGWTAATVADEAVIQAVVFTAMSESPWALLRGATTLRATAEFWANDGALADLGPIRRGTELPAGHPLARAFPSLFEPVAVEATVSIGSPARRLSAGPLPIVSAAEVLAKRAELEAAGKDAGYDTLARALGVSRETIRRRLTAPG